MKITDMIAKELLDMLEQDGAFSGELYAAGVAAEKLCSETFLQLADGLADSRLADIQFPGGP